MKPVEIAQGIYDVGVNDWNISDFHGYSTPFGTSYNAYLILDEKVTLVDTVKKGFEKDLLRHIASIVDPKRIDYVISNHTEMDHSGSLAAVMRAVGEDKPIFCSKMGRKTLAAHFHSPLNFQAVENGATLSLGRRSATFMETRMLHWPDSMFTYLNEDKILFSSDAFGQHYAGHEQFDDVIGDAIMPHAKKYFANILLHFSPLLLKLIDKVAAMNLDIRMICPDHGVIWRSDPARIVAAYARWSRQESKGKAIVVYDTMWRSTEAMADAISTGIAEKGIEVRPMYLRKWHRSDVLTEVLDAKAIVVGSPTLNNGMFPTVADFLTYVKGLRPQNKLGAAFGSYGWSGEAVKLIEAELAAMNFALIADGLRQQYVPDREGHAACVEFGRRIGDAVRQSREQAGR